MLRRHAALNFSDKLRTKCSLKYEKMQPPREVGTLRTTWQNKIPHALHYRTSSDELAAKHLHVFSDVDGKVSDDASSMWERHTRDLKHAERDNTASSLSKSPHLQTSEKNQVLLQPLPSGNTKINCEATLSSADAAVSTSATMTRDQQEVLNLALEGASLFIGGEAGTGKSYLLTAIAAALEAAGLHVAVTASTGIAALNIGGNTFHSAFGVPLPTPDELTDVSPPRRTRSSSSCRRNRRIREHEQAYEGAEATLEEDQDYDTINDDEQLQATPSSMRQPQRLHFKNIAALATVDVILLDEVSLLHAGFLEALDRALRRTAGRDARRPFGGVQVILSGDFMQLTPFVSPDASLGGGVRGLPTHSFSNDGFAATEADTAGSLKSDRRVCTGVLKPRVSDARSQSEKPTISKGYGQPIAQRHAPFAAAAAAGAAAPDAHECNSEARKQQSADTKSPLSRCESSRRKREVWYYDKPMFESWCFRRHLLHVQLREPQRHTDLGFAADLNQLRCGKLPFRISRSAYLNPVDEGAVRLLPTKAAVRNYNDRRMLELDGEGRVFRTQLILTEATSLLTPSPSTKAEGADQRTVPSCSAAMLIQYRLRTPQKRHRCVSPYTTKGILSSQELRRSERAIERHCKLPAHSVQLRALPVPLAYSPALCTLSLQCVAATEKAAQSRRATVQTALEKCLPVLLEKATLTNKSVPVLKAIGSTASKAAALFPREIVRLEPIVWSQLLRRLQPALLQNFRQALRKDTVLQDKTLKLGCRVMLLRNLSSTYVNGSLGTITRYMPAAECWHLLPPDMKATAAGAVVRTSILASGAAEPRNTSTPAVEESSSATPTLLPIVRMDADGKEVAIPWIVLPVPVVHGDWCYVLRATCVPLTPAYAFTVHKIQGVTLDHSVLFDADGMFPCDHLVYVAASRVRRFEQLRIINLTPGMISVHVPSLDFTRTIPSVDAARQTWDAWRTQHAGSATSLFLPSHKLDSGRVRGEHQKDDSTTPLS